jgi:hypothetical protein
MAENPFIFGKVVRGKHFCDREKEIKRINELVKSKQHMVIISPRRYGKTSLVINALERSKTPHLYLDCSLIESEKDLVSLILNAYARKLDSIALAEKALKRIDVSVSLSISPVTVKVSGIRRDSLRGSILEAGRNYVLVFDEFQDIYGKSRGTVKKLRSTVQFLEKSAIMLGSRRHLLDSMFLKPRGIFYNFGYALHLGKIGREEFANFITRSFGENGLGITREEVAEALDVTGCHPFFTQYLCHFLFEKKKASKSAGVKETLADILVSNSVFYEENYRALPSSQRKALLLLSCGKKEVYSAKLIEKFGITSSQALQKALGALMKKEIVDKNGDYYIIDLFFGHWLYQKVLNQKV